MKTANTDFLTALIQKADSLSQVSEVLERIERLALALRATPDTVATIKETVVEAPLLSHRGSEIRPYGRRYPGAPKNHGYAWTYKEKMILQAMHADGKTDSEIGARLGRTEGAVMIQRHKMLLHKTTGFSPATPAQGDLQLNGAGAR